MIKAESKIVEDESCEIEMLVDGSIKDLEMEAVIIIQHLFEQISEHNGANQSELLASFICKLLKQCGGVEYEINRYRRK